MTIPFVDVAGQTKALRAEVLRAIERILDDAAFIGGQAVKDFERAFCDELGLPDGAGCSSGTSALSLVLEAAGIGPGDEVITSAHTFFATAEAICHVGATPVFADIDPRTYTIDPAAVDAAVTPRTRALLPVHLYGTPADMGALQAVADRHGLVVLEDAAQAHLARIGDRAVGSMGDAAAFSFYPGKNLGAFGDAGFFVTRHDDWRRRARMLLDHGRTSKYEHEIVGYNHRIDAVQAAILGVKLPHLRTWTEHRRAVAAAYDEQLRPAGFKTIDVPDGFEAVYHLFVVEVSNRDEMLDRLRAAGIGCGVHYPVPLHLQPAFADLKVAKGSLPVTERAADRVLSLPIDGHIDLHDVHSVCEHFLAAARP